MGDLEETEVGLLAKSESRRGFTAVILAALMALLAVEASAHTISAVERGWVWEQGSLYGSNGASATNNYIAGRGSAADQDFRHWLAALPAERR